MTAAVPEPRDLTADEAEECIAGIRAAVTRGWEWIAKAVNGRAWIALGYESWDAMCQDRLDGVRLALPRAERQEAVAQLREQGVSTRAIASGLGIDRNTVMKDARLAESQPVAVTSLDGRQRPATQPPHPTAKVTETTKTETFVDTATGEIVEQLDDAERTMVDAINERLPNAAGEIAAARLRSRWSSAIAAASAIPTMNEEDVAAVLTPSEISAAHLMARELVKFVGKVEAARSRGLRIVGSTK